MTAAYPSLTRAMAEAFVDVLWFVESCEDEQMHPDDAVKVLEGVAHWATRLTDDQRAELLELLDTMAEAEPSPARREFLEGFAVGFGLVDE
ncbi:hypothetical protein Stsp02_27110 [Streptomyces sp. NBRC 14336]|nr:hypothetical protein Stsp02_27110 [Streptomyces sp. NBRC 14336]